MMSPDDFVLRDVRKSAAPHLGCQVPEVTAYIGPWAGSEGNVTAFCRGVEIHYYLRCITNHQCKATIAD